MLFDVTHARLGPALFFIVAALGGSLRVAADEMPISDGPQLYARFCASCHGLEGRGNGPVAGAIKVEIPDLTRLAARAGGEFPAERVKRVIDGRSIFNAHGTRQMPVWGQEFWLQEGADEEAERKVEETIESLVEYLRTIQYRSGASR